MGQGSSRRDNHPADDARRRLPREGHQHGRLHGSPPPHPGIHRRLPRLLDQLVQLPDELPARRLRPARRNDGLDDGRPQGIQGRHQRFRARQRQARELPRHADGQALQRGRVCMAPPRLSPARDPLQPVREEHRADEPSRHEPEQAPFQQHRQGHLEHDSRKDGQAARQART